MMIARSDRWSFLSMLALCSAGLAACSSEDGNSPAQDRPGSDGNASSVASGGATATAEQHTGGDGSGLETGGSAGAGVADTGGTGSASAATTGGAGVATDGGAAPVGGTTGSAAATQTGGAQSDGGQGTTGGVEGAGSPGDGGQGPDGSDATGGAAASSGGNATGGGAAGAGGSPPVTGVVIPSRIEAEDFVRYNEIDASNDTADCGDETADLGTTTDDDGGCYVGWTQADEWLEYDVWVATSADFNISIRMASQEPGQTVQILVDGEAVGTLTAPGAGWTAFDTVTLEGVSMTQGAHVVRVFFETGQANVNYLLFETDGAGTGSTGGASGTGGGSGTGGSEEAGGSSGTGGGEEAGGTGASPGTEKQCDSAPAGYTLAWSDEFDYDGLPDPDRWGFEIGGDGWGNNELQYYTDRRLENASVSRATGLLTVTAIYENYQGNSYTSAKLNSGRGSGNPGAWNEGVIDIRARLPAGLGTWPALWMMPTQCTEGWPNCGEIDVMEHVGYEEGQIYGTIHTDAFNHVEGTQKGGDTFVADATEAFHVYSLAWTADRMEWLVDGNVYYTVERESGWGFAQWPFSEKVFHLMINIAVGGDWGGAQGVNSAHYPTSMDVDYVCVYQSGG